MPMYIHYVPVVSDSPTLDLIDLRWDYEHMNLASVVQFMERHNASYLLDYEEHGAPAIDVRYVLERAGVIQKYEDELYYAGPQFVSFMGWAKGILKDCTRMTNSVLVPEPSDVKA